MAEWIIEIKDGKFPIGKWTELVRCKDCKNRSTEDCIRFCPDCFYCNTTDDDDFCSWGERKDEVEE